MHSYSLLKRLELIYLRTCLTYNSTDSQKVIKRYTSQGLAWERFKSSHLRQLIYTIQCGTHWYLVKKSIFAGAVKLQTRKIGAV